MIERSTKMIVYLKVHPKNIVHEKLDRSNKRAVLIQGCCDFAAIGAIFDRVSDQVVHDLYYPLLVKVSYQHTGRGKAFQYQSDAMTPSSDFLTFNHLFQSGMQIKQGAM